MVDLKNMNFNHNKLLPLKGDASFRIFYRKKNKSSSSIIVYAKKEKTKNLLNYTSINKILLKKKISAPKLVFQNYKNNYIEIEDLGNKTIYEILKKNKKKEIFYSVLKILVKLQKIKTKKIKNFKNRYYKIPTYSKNLLLKEANLFLEWYVPSIYKKKKYTINKKLKKIIKNLVDNLNLPNDTFVHRDFHVSNLMLNNKKISVIDSQDAVYGNIAYDLASLIDDVRLKTSKKIKDLIYKKYFYFNKKKINKKSFKNDFEILSVLRNLKIIGIFSRLSKRDNKKQYPKLIPHAWKLIELRIKDNDVFKDLKNNLDKNFSKKIRTRK